MSFAVVLESRLVSGPFPRWNTPITTICHFAQNQGSNYILCVGSDGIGVETYKNTLYAYDIFVSSQASCPASFNGVSFDSFNPISSTVTGFYEFTAAEISRLGLPAFECTYL